MTKQQLAATNLAISNLGGLTEVSRRYDITVQAVQNWRVRGVPQDRVKQVAADSGVPREKLLPELYA
jgi:hypothetical protein